jgi:hypothetical protein
VDGRDKHGQDGWSIKASPSNSAAELIDSQ